MDSFELQILFDTMFYRQTLLESCKNQQEKDKLEDRWAIEDGFDKIARAIRNRPVERSKFLGLF